MLDRTQLDRDFPILLP